MSNWECKEITYKSIMALVVELLHKIKFRVLIFYPLVCLFLLAYVFVRDSSLDALVHAVAVSSRKEIFYFLNIVMMFSVICALASVVPSLYKEKFKG